MKFIQHGISDRGDKADVEALEKVSFEVLFRNTGVFGGKLSKVGYIADSFMMNHTRCLEDER